MKLQNLLMLGSFAIFITGCEPKIIYVPQKAYIPVVPDFKIPPEPDYKSICTVDTNNTLEDTLSCFISRDTTKNNYILDLNAELKALKSKDTFVKKLDESVK